MKNFNDLKSIINSIEDDAIKFYKSNGKGAGARLSNAMNKVKKLAQKIRIEVSEIKNKKITDLV